MHAEAIERLTAIERSIDTQALTYGDICYWPLARLRLWSALMRRMVVGRKSAGETVANSGPAWADVGRVSAEIAEPSGLGLLKAARTTPDPIDAAQLLFFTRPEEYVEKTASGAFAKIIDSLFERARPRGATKIELADPRTLGFERLYPSLFLDLTRAAEGVRFDPPGVLAGLAELKDAAASHAVVDENDLLTGMGKIFYFARIFEKVLRHVRPRALILSVYYHPVGMAWMLAARRAGVVSIDLQHGRLGPHHGLYTDLTAAPADGYALMPDRVWCWGSRTVADIARANNPRCRRHQGFVGGNPWLYKWRYGDVAAFSPPGLGAFEERTRGRRKILVSLQPLDNPLSPTLLDAMKTAPEDWIWLLRLHPLRRHTATEVAAILKRHGVTRVEIEDATAFPLFILLRMADHHVTVFSSVTVEAAAFGLRTSLTSEEGVAAFGPEIADGTARYTPTPEAVLGHIHEVLAGARHPRTGNFIDMSEGVIDRALGAILGQ